MRRRRRRGAKLNSARAPRAAVGAAPTPQPRCLMQRVAGGNLHWLHYSNASAARLGGLGGGRAGLSRRGFNSGGFQRRRVQNGLDVRCLSVAPVPGALRRPRAPSEASDVRLSSGPGDEDSEESCRWPYRESASALRTALLASKRRCPAFGTGAGKNIAWRRNPLGGCLDALSLRLPGTSISFPKHRH